MGDRHFDELSLRFAQNIYGSNKGAIRLAVMQADLQQLELQAPLRVLDVGAGLGHMALWLAQQGHQLTLCEPSAPMLAQAKASFAEQGVAAEFIHADWQQLTGMNLPPFDVILCHAVLEWLAEPFALLAALKPLLKSGGWLSLAFYNKDALILQNLIKGNLRKISKQRFAGDNGSLTPQQPLASADVSQALQASGWQIQSRSGIRVFHDYMRPEARNRIADAELIATELAYRQHPTLGPLGRYQHWLCQ